MKQIKDLTGQKFGRLTVIKFYEKRKRNTGSSYKYYWLCRCQCGNKIIVDVDNLKNNSTKSCGCISKEKPAHITHGLTNTLLYGVWGGIKTRCLNKNYKKYKDYGGRGIIICDEWLNDFSSFYNWSIENGYKKGLTIDRIDVNRNYEPKNCRWTTQKVQQNNRRNNKRKELKNEINS